MMDSTQALNIPAHVAIIMDGNGRWAQSRGLTRLIGHNKGGEVAKNIIKAAAKNGVKYLTLYAFSSENWNRPADEVSGLMELLGSYIKKETASLRSNNIRVRVIGDLDKLSESLRADIIKVTLDTEKNTGMTLIIALSYGGRDEIIRAVKNIAVELKKGELLEKDVDERCFENYLYTSTFPDPDLLIRTGGELRISNFLLWQCAYSEFYFTNTKWPDFSENEFVLALKEFGKRKRRYGK